MKYEYMLVKEFNTKKLVKRINEELIPLGWLPIGGFTMQPTGNYREEGSQYNYLYIQPLLRMQDDA